MPKKAIIRRTNSVKSGPRSQGGGTRNNGWNCLILALLPFVVLLAVCALAGLL